jgi:tripartite-type tricarboxylate transporter receptor subunit TctC
MPTRHPVYHRQMLRILLPSALLALSAHFAQAQGFPTRPIIVVNQQIAGGPSDVTMRVIGQKMAESVGQPVLVESRPGGGGTVGAIYVKQAPPDGYLLFLANVASHGVNRAVKLSGAKVE